MRSLLVSPEPAGGPAVAPLASLGAVNDALVSLAALEVACDEGVTRHVSRLDEALARAPPADRPVLERVRETLLIHLALLLHRPDALWPALYAHCAFVDSPRARTFGVSAPGPHMPVFSQVGRWLSERRALHPEAPWLRALTPTTPWGGALEAELRGLEQPRVAAMTDDQVSLTAGGQHLAWRPASGAVSAEQPAESPPPLVATPPGGGLMVAGPRAPERPAWLLPPGWSISRVASAQTRVACLAWNGDEAVLFVFDVATGAQLASLQAPEGEALALSADGAYLAWQSQGGATVRHLDSGTEARVETGRFSTAAVSPGGRRLCVAERGVVRVYRPHAGPAWRPFVERPLAPAFSRDGAALLLGQFVLAGSDGSVRQAHAFRTIEYMEGGPPPFGVRVTPKRVCVCEAFSTETLAIDTGRVTTVSGVHAGPRHRVAWSGDGLVLATCRQGDEEVTLHLARGRRTVRASGPLEGLALDETGSQLALLHVDGTVELQAGGTRLRAVPGATGLCFVARDSALAVGGRQATVVLGLDGAERWSAPTPFEPTDACACEVEWRSGLRAPSVAEALVLTSAKGLLTASAGAAGAVFPSGTARWVRSPAGALLAHGTTLLSWEGV